MEWEWTVYNRVQKDRWLLCWCWRAKHSILSFNNFQPGCCFKVTFNLYLFMWQNTRVVKHVNIETGCEELIWRFFFLSMHSFYFLFFLQIRIVLLKKKRRWLRNGIKNQELLISFEMYRSKKWITKNICFFYTKSQTHDHVQWVKKILNKNF